MLQIPIKKERTIINRLPPLLHIRQVKREVKGEIKIILNLLLFLTSLIKLSILRLPRDHSRIRMRCSSLKTNLTELNRCRKPTTSIRKTPIRLSV